MKPQTFLRRLLQIVIFTLLTLSFCQTLPSLAMAYTPPIGIPDPGTWGVTHPIDSNAPSTNTKCPSWPSTASSGCYYIDNSAVGATDTNNTYGTPEKPRLSFPTFNFAAGSYIELHGTYGSPLNITLNGTAANPVWFRGSVGKLPLLTSYINITNSQYAFIEYLEFNGGNNGCISITGTTGNNIVIRNSKFKNRTFVSNCSAVAMTPAQNYVFHDIVVYNCEFSELGNWNSFDDTVDEDFHGIGPSTFGRTPPTELHHVWMLNNSFYHISGNGIQVVGSSKIMVDFLHHIYIGKNTGSEIRQAPFWSKQASHVIMSENIAHDCYAHGRQYGNGIGYQYGPDNVWIIFNEIYNASNGIRQSDTSDAYYDPTQPQHNIYIIGNLIHDIAPAPYEDPLLTSGTRPGCAITFWSGAPTFENRYVVDNTIYNSNNGINSVQAGNIEAANNIISGVSATGWHVYTLNNTLQFHLNGNTIYSANNGQRVYWHPTGYTALSSFITAKGECNDCIFSDPKFIAPENNNFSLSLGSPSAISWKRHAVYDTFEALYGIDISKNIDGYSRSTPALASPIPVVKKITISSN